MKNKEEQHRGSLIARAAAVATLAASLMLLGVCGCRPPAVSPQSGSPGTQPDSSAFTIGINQYMQQPVLDEVAKGVVDELEAQNITADHGHKIIQQNSNGDQSVSAQISKQFVSQSVDLIIALGTPAAQSACKETQTIPVVFGAITDPVSAKLAESLDRPGGNKTGTSNRWPYEKQVELIKEIVPDARTVGIVLNPSEANTQASMGFIRPALATQGLEAVEVPVASTTEVLNAAKSLVGRCDVLLIPGCNTVVSAIDALAKVARESKIPLIGGSADMIDKGSIATYASNDYDLGRRTAQMALEILRDGKEPGTMPVAFTEAPSLMVNEGEAALQSVQLPPDLVEQAGTSRQ